jgi:hypothetical protein
VLGPVGRLWLDRVTRLCVSDQSSQTATSAVQTATSGARVSVAPGGPVAVAVTVTVTMTVAVTVVACVVAGVAVMALPTFVAGYRSTAMVALDGGVQGALAVVSRALAVHACMRAVLAPGVSALTRVGVRGVIAVPCGRPDGAIAVDEAVVSEPVEPRDGAQCRGELGSQQRRGVQAVGARAG